MDFRHRRYNQTLQSRTVRLAFCLLFLLTGCAKIPCTRCDREQISCTALERMPYSCPDLEEAVALSLQCNSKFAASLSKLNIQAAEIMQSGLLKNPLVGFAYRFIDKPNTVSVIDLEAMQPLLDTLLIPQKIRASKKRYSALKCGLIKEAVNLIAAVKMAYIDFLSLKEMGAVMENFVLAKEAAFVAALQMKKAGNIAEFALLERQTEYERSKVRLADLALNIRIAKQKLAYLIGFPGHLVIEPQALPEPPSDMSELCKILEIAFIHNLDLCQMRNELKAIDAEGEVYINKMIFCEMEIGSSAERESDGTWTVGPSFFTAIPLFDFGQAASYFVQSERSTKYKQMQAVADNLIKTGHVVFDGVQTASSNYQLYARHLSPTASSLFEQAHLQYNAMQFGVLTLLDVKAAELEIAFEELGRKQTMLQAYVQLEQFLAGSLPKEEL